MSLGSHWFLPCGSDPQQDTFLQQMQKLGTGGQTAHGVGGEGPLRWVYEGHPLLFCLSQITRAATTITLLSGVGLATFIGSMPCAEPFL